MPQTFRCGEKDQTHMLGGINIVRAGSYVSAEELHGGPEGKGWSRDSEQRLAPQTRQEGFQPLPHRCRRLSSDSLSKVREESEG